MRRKSQRDVAAFINPGENANMPFLRIKSELIYYHQAGETGRADGTVVLLHGAGGTGRKWDAQLAGIDGRRLIAPDLPGHGQSEGEARSSVAEYREFVSEFVKALGNMRFIICGHSLGGAIALDLALTGQELMDGLILVGSGGRLRVKPETLEMLARGEYPVGNLEYHYAFNASTDILDRASREMKGIPSGVYLADLRACDAFDVLDRLRDIRVPTLVICGKDDRMTPVKFSEHLSGHIPNAKLALVPDAGHMVMIEQPRMVNEHIVAFLDALRA